MNDSLIVTKQIVPLAGSPGAVVDWVASVAGIIDKETTCVVAVWSPDTLVASSTTTFAAAESALEQQNRIADIVSNAVAQLFPDRHSLGLLKDDYFVIVHDTASNDVWCVGVVGNNAEENARLGKVAVDWLTIMS